MKNDPNSNQSIPNHPKNPNIYLTNPLNSHIQKPTSKSKIHPITPHLAKFQNIPKSIKTYINQL